MSTALAPLALAAGSTIFLVFLVIMVFGLAFTLFGRKGSNITEHPSDGMDGAPGSAAPSEVAGRGRSGEAEPGAPETSGATGSGDAFSSHGTR